MVRKHICVLGFFAFVVSLAQAVPLSDLADELSAQTVSLVSAHGTGASSGASIKAVLKNETDTEKRIPVYLDKALYLVNKGKGQNMIALQVYLDSGEYYSDGRNYFIILPPKKKTAVVFVAYCADFEKDNPQKNESFKLGTLPEDITDVILKIRLYTKEHPEQDITVAAQLALWLAQGEKANKIAEKFPFSAEDEKLAQYFLKK